MARKVTDLESASKKLTKAKHIDPAIILTNESGTTSIGPIDQRWEIGSITKVFNLITERRRKKLTPGQLAFIDKSKDSSAGAFLPTHFYELL